MYTFAPNDEYLVKAFQLNENSISNKLLIDFFRFITKVGYSNGATPFRRMDIVYTVDRFDDQTLNHPYLIIDYGQNNDPQKRIIVKWNEWFVYDIYRNQYEILTDNEFCSIYKKNI